MKQFVYVVAALSACSAVASADLTLDTFNGGGFSASGSGSYLSGSFTGPTESNIPGQWGSRLVYADIQGTGTGSFSVNSGGNGAANLGWNITTPGSGIAIAGLQMYYYFNSGFSPVSSPFLAIEGSGSFTGSYLTSEVMVQLSDTNSNSAFWWVPFTGGAFNGTMLDVTSTPGFTSGAFDINSVSMVYLQFSFVIFPGATGQGGAPGPFDGAGSLSMTNIAFVPAPGVAALLSLGSLASMRRRR